MGKFKRLSIGSTSSGDGRSVSRAMNQTAIVDRIYECGGISKAQLAKDLGISKPTVTSIVSDLISIGLVEERGEGKAAKSGGRKPVMLYFNSNYRYVGALDMSFREPVCAVCDLQYNIIGIRRINADKKSTPEEKRRLVLQTFLDILEEKELLPEILGQIVISHPGIIKEETAEHYAEQRHHYWAGIELKHYLQEEMKIPIYVRNDVNLAAIGEMHFGNDEQLRDLIYVSCGVGLGAGVIMDGELYEGKGYAAGEIGAMLMNDGIRFEDALSIEGLVDKIKQLNHEIGRTEEVTFQYIVEKTKENDVIVSRAVFETGRELGRVIFNCCVLLDISTVIFGGEYLELGQVLFDGIKDALPKGSVYHPKVSPSVLNQIAGIYGGFVMGKDKIIESLANNI